MRPKYHDVTTEGPDEARPRRGLVIAVVAVALLGAYLVSADTDAPVIDGHQLNTPYVRNTTATGRPWTAMPPLSGLTRDGRPGPMVADDGEVCLGFERLDHPPPRLPSIARCVAPIDRDAIPADGLVNLVRVEAGPDFWHLLEMSGAVEQVSVLGSNGPLTEDRIHVLDELVLLRIGRSEALTELRWRSGRAEVRCVPEPEAARTGQFCSLEAEQPRVEEDVG